MQIILYPKCSTCQKALKHLQQLNLSYQTRDIVLEKLTIQELDNLINKSNLDINKFFNTSGILYRSMNLSSKLPSMTYQEKISLLASNGMLVKRPILELDNKVIIGYKPQEYENLIK